MTIEKTVLGNDTLIKFDSSTIEQEGSLMTVKNKKINVVLPSLGYIMTAEVETSNVRIISSDNLVHRPKLMSPKLFNPVHSFNNFFNHVEQVKKFELLPNEWTIDSGELTPTLKLKRKVIMEKYKDVLGRIYNSHSTA